MLGQFRIYSLNLCQYVDSKNLFINQKGEVVYFNKKNQFEIIYNPLIPQNHQNYIREFSIGIKDIDGNEIFEGDTFKTTIFEEHIKRKIDVVCCIRFLNGKAVGYYHTIEEPKMVEGKIELPKKLKIISKKG